MPDSGITLIHRKQEYHLQGPLRVKQALESLGLMVESFLVLRDGELLVESELLRNGDVVRLIATVSGG